MSTNSSIQEGGKIARPSIQGIAREQKKLRAALPPPAYYDAMWLPLTLQIIPAIKSWLTNIATMNQPATSTASDQSTTGGVHLSNEITDRTDRMKLKILDCLNTLANISDNAEYTKILFLGDKILRKQIQDLQFSSNAKVYARASAFLAKHYTTLDLDAEIDLFIESIKDAPQSEIIVSEQTKSVNTAADKTASVRTSMHDKHFARDEGASVNLVLPKRPTMSTMSK